MLNDGTIRHFQANCFEMVSWSDGDTLMLIPIWSEDSTHTMLEGSKKNGRVR